MLKDSEIGGAFVHRPVYTFDDQGNQLTWMRGVQLSADKVLGMPLSNRRALVASGAIELYPIPPSGAVADAQLKAQVADLKKQLAESARRETALVQELKSLKTVKPKAAVKRTGK